MKTWMICFFLAVLAIVAFTVGIGCDDDDDDDSGDDDDDDNDDDNNDNDDDNDDDDNNDNDDDNDDDDDADYAVGFSANDAYVAVPHSQSLNISGSDITLEAWIKINEYQDDWEHIVNKLSAGKGYRFRFDPNNLLQFTIYNGGQDSMCVNYYTNVLPTGEWHHIAGTFDGADCRIYIDGYEVDEDATTTSTIGTSTANLYLGAFPGQLGFLGVLDEVRVSNIVKYNANFTPAEYLDADLGVAGLWHLDEGAGLVTYDASGNDNTGNLHGAEWVSGE